MRWACLLLLLTFAVAVESQPVELLVFPNPGLFEPAAGGEISGRGATIMKRLGEVTGVPLRMRPVPAARAMQMIDTLPGTCAAGVVRTADREGLYRWAGVIASGALVLYGRSDETREVADAADLRGAVIAAQRESRALIWLREQGLTAYEVNDTVTGLRMLRAGRVDFWFVNDLPGGRAIQLSEGPPPKALREFGRVELHLACHRELPAATAERLRAGFDQLRRNGELGQLGLR